MELGKLEEEERWFEVGVFRRKNTKTESEIYYDKEEEEGVQETRERSSSEKGIHFRKKRLGN